MTWEAWKADEGPLVRLLPPIPLHLFGALVEAIEEACEREGYEAFFKQEDGLEVVHARRRRGSRPQSP